MLSFFIDLAIQIFQAYGKVMNGSLFILQGLVCTVDERITPFVPKFIEYIICSLRMENCDMMGTRLACGLVSDLSNSIQDGILQWLPKLAECLHKVLVENAFESDAKLVAITAFGDLSLAAGASNFYAYLDPTMTAFHQANKLSLGTGKSTDEIDLLGRLRIALIDAYISILHGLWPDENH